MNYEEESYVLDTLKEVKERIRDMPDIKQMAKEVHENNIMLKQIIKVINTYITNHHNENDADFDRNVFANILSGMFDIGNFNRR